MTPNRALVCCVLLAAPVFVMLAFTLSVAVEAAVSATVFGF